MSSDGLSAYFHSDRLGNGVRFLGGYDLFIARRRNLGEAFANPTRIDELSIPAQGELSPSLERDELTLYFDSYRPTRHLWRARRPNLASAWQDTQELTLLRSPENEDFDPYVTRDGSQLYFTSSRPTGTGRPGFNLFVASMKSGEPQAFEQVQGVNSDLHERHAVPSSDGLRLFFSRNSPQSVDTTDVYVAQRNSLDAAFTEVTPVSELNTSRSEFPTWLSHDGCQLYFTSDRDGTDDLYMATRTAL